MVELWFCACLTSFIITLFSADSTGTHSLYTTYKDFELMFHVSTLLPYMPNNRQQVRPPVCVMYVPIPMSTSTSIQPPIPTVQLGKSETEILHLSRRLLLLCYSNYCSISEPLWEYCCIFNWSGNWEADYADFLREPHVYHVNCENNCVDRQVSTCG